MCTHVWTSQNDFEFNISTIEEFNVSVDSDVLILNIAYSLTVTETIDLEVITYCIKARYKGEIFDTLVLSLMYKDGGISIVEYNWKVVNFAI